MTAAADRLRQLLADATPGPWIRIIEAEEPHWVYVLDAETRQVFTTMGGSVEKEHANARLAALAPELATLAVDMSEIISSLAASGHVRSQDLMARLARLIAPTSRQEHG